MRDLTYNPYTPIQKRMLAKLADGLPHKDIELHSCLNDTLAPISNIRAHLTLIRKHLRAVGQDIVSIRENGQVYYQHVRIVAPSSAE
jgi:hypothetical protein